MIFLSLNQQTVGEMLQLAKNYDKALEEEEKMTPEQLAIKNVGKLDPKRHLEEKVDVLMTNNVHKNRPSTSYCILHPSFLPSGFVDL